MAISAFLPRLPLCSLGEFLYSLYGQNRVQPARAHLFLPLYALVTDMILSPTAMSNIPQQFLVPWQRDLFEACLIQIFLTNSICCIASGFILVMPVDWYVAICSLLRIAAILTHTVIQNLGVVIVFCGVFLFSPHQLCCHLLHCVPSPILSSSAEDLDYLRIPRLWYLSSLCTSFSLLQYVWS